MKKTAVSLFLLLCLVNFPSSAYASEGLIKPNSRFYFLQKLGESVKLFLIKSPEKKLDYLLDLSDRRVEEIKNTPSLKTVDSYEENFSQLNDLSNQVKDKQQAIEKIKEASLRQQAVLSRVYEKVPEKAKNAIINAQENSSKHVTKIIEKIEGQKKAQEFVQQLEQVPMENTPNLDPSKNKPRELKEIKKPLPVQKINSSNSVNNQKEDNKNSNKIEPAKPIEMIAPVKQ